MTHCRYIYLFSFSSHSAPFSLISLNTRRHVFAQYTRSSVQCIEMQTKRFVRSVSSRANFNSFDVSVLFDSFIVAGGIIVVYQTWTKKKRKSNMSSAPLTVPDDLKKLFAWVSSDFNFILVCLTIFICVCIIYLFCSHIDANKTRYIDVLREAVAIKSVSAWADHRPEISKMAKWTAERLKKLGVHVELAELGNQTLHDGSVIPLPEVVLGTLTVVSIQVSEIYERNQPLGNTIFDVFGVPLISMLLVGRISPLQRKRSIWKLFWNVHSSLVRIS